MPGTVTSGLARAAGADLYYERRGTGPPLLMITGGGGDGGYFTAAADLLADRYTVITYDRRGNSRSPLHGPPAAITMPGQSADAVAVLAANGFGSAAIFGNSGGATIALDLAARHPAAVTAMVCHEPPVPTVLPDPAAYLAIHDEMGKLLLTDGWPAAFRRFQTDILGRLPGGRLPPGPARDVVLRMSGNWEFMTRYEIRSFIDHRPDVASIRGNHVRVALAYGAETTHIAAAEMSRALAARLSAECAILPGGHAGPQDDPAAFAAPLRELLGRTLAGRQETG
jgi:acetyltransferase/esterase